MLTRVVVILPLIHTVCGLTVELSERPEAVKNPLRGNHIPAWRRQLGQDGFESDQAPVDCDQSQLNNENSTIATSNKDIDVFPCSYPDIQTTDPIAQTSNPTTSPVAQTPDPNVQTPQRDYVRLSVSVAIPSSHGQEALVALEDHVIDASTDLFNSNFDDAMYYFKALNKESVALPTFRDFALRNFDELVQKASDAFNGVFPLFQEYVEASFNERVANATRTYGHYIATALENEESREDLKTLYDDMLENWDEWIKDIRRIFNKARSFFVDEFNRLGDQHDFTYYESILLHWLDLANSVEPFTDDVFFDANQTNTTGSNNSTFAPLVEIRFYRLTSSPVLLKYHYKYNNGDWAWWKYQMSFRIYYLSPDGSKVLLDDPLALDYLNSFLNEILTFSVVSGLYMDILSEKAEEDGIVEILAVAMPGLEEDVAREIIDNLPSTPAPTQRPTTSSPTTAMPSTSPTTMKPTPLEGTFQTELECCQEILQSNRFQAGLSLFALVATIVAFLVGLSRISRITCRRQETEFATWASNQGLEEMLKLGWREGVEKFEVIDKGLFGYSDDDSMLMGGFESVHNLSMEVCKKVAPSDFESAASTERNTFGSETRDSRKDKSSTDSMPLESSASSQSSRHSSSFPSQSDD